MNTKFTPVGKLFMAVFGSEPSDPEAGLFLEVLVGTLPDRFAFVLRKRFGLDGPALTGKEIGKLLKRSQSAVFAAERKALRMMRHPFRSGVMRQFLQASPELRKEMFALTNVPALARWQHDSHWSIGALPLPLQCSTALRKLGVRTFDDLPLPIDARAFLADEFGLTVIETLESCLADFGVPLFDAASVRSTADLLASLAAGRPREYPEQIRLASYSRLISDLLPRHSGELPAMDQDTCRFVDMLVNTTGQQCALIIRKLYGLDGPAMAKHAIAHLLGFSESRMQYVVSRAFRMLHHPVRSQALIDFLYSAPDARQAMFSLTSIEALCRRQQNVKPPLVVDLDLSDRAVRFLQAMGADNANDFPLSSSENARLPAGLGKSTMSEIEKCLDSHGLHFDFRAT